MRELFDKDFPGVGGGAMTIKGSHITRWGTGLDQRVVPCSTFKIVLAHLALEAKLVKSAEEIWKFSGKKSGRVEWGRDLCLRTALETSAEWYFQDVARKLGAERLRAGVKKLGYGSGWSGKTPASAWHDGTLTISPMEHVLVMQRLSAGTWPFFAPIQTSVKKCLAYPVDGDVQLWGKTGSSEKGKDGRALGWYVGAFLREGEATSFAILCHAPNALGPRVRDELVKRLATHY
ncbi:penicillin-binding transpeptidase domain-containing protein [Armatimonas sp.]|uniref:penicillin-binding transpeptidase domain-containing protein n=1 Tax=Armatimonas sp. TaxID=1872638 RepID=UPI00375281AA